MNNLQRFIIVIDGKKVIGTDSGQAFTENAAHQKCALLQEELKDKEVTVEEIQPFFKSLL